MGKINKKRHNKSLKDGLQLPSITKPDQKNKTEKPQKSNDKISFSKNSGIKKNNKKKKDKRNSKHKNLITKINLIKVQEKETIMKKKREKTVITGDLRPLKDALPSLDELFKFKTSEIKTGLVELDSTKTTSQIKKDKHKKKKRELIDRYKSFANLMKDPDYKKNARETIANHIKFTRDT